MKNFQKITQRVRSNLLIGVFLLTVFLKSLVFVSVVPMWHTPDEQAHFAQTAFFVEFGHMPYTGYDLNREIYESERLLGTLRDERGNNKFTYHPEYRIDYSPTVDGKFENRIKDIPISDRKELVKQEAASYPPLYYWLTAIPYGFFYQSDLITRVFSVRMVSIILSLGTAFVCWLIGKRLFPGDNLKAITLSSLVAFQPMFSFVSAGVNSDNLMNLLFTILLYLSLLAIQQGPKIKILILVSIIFILLYFTKPQSIFGIPIFLTAVLLWFISQKRIKILYKASLVTALFVLGIGLLWLIESRTLNTLLSNFGNIYSFDPGPKRADMNINLFNFLYSAIKHTYAETLPWYWGVFNWLGVTLPRDANRIINRILLISFIGFGIWIYKNYRKFNQEKMMVVFLALSSLIYYLAVTYYNYLFTLAHTFSFGIQGRYFFPLITAHMGIILIGLISLIPQKYIKLERLFLLLITTLSISLNFVGIYTIITSYYDTSGLNSLIIQMSQYKPSYFKGQNLINLFVIYLVTLSILIRFLFKSAFFKTKSR